MSQRVEWRMEIILDCKEAASCSQFLDSWKRDFVSVIHALTLIAEFVIRNTHPIDLCGVIFSGPSQPKQKSVPEVLKVENQMTSVDFPTYL